MATAEKIIFLPPLCGAARCFGAFPLALHPFHRIFRPAEAELIGDEIRIFHLKGEDSHYDGVTGTVEHIDGMGRLHGTWGGLAVIPDEDDFEILR